MGDFFSSLLGTNSSVNTSSTDAYSALNNWQNQAQTLANQLQTQSAGGGPNPAQLQFQQNANQIAQQGANTYAANRALNPGLAARLAGNQTAQIQGQAAGTAAIQQAQQQLASQHLLENLYGQQEGALNQAGAINAGIAAGNQQQAGNIVGGIFNGIGTAAMALSKGGKVTNRKTAQVPAQSRFPEQSGFPGQSNYDDGGLVMPTFGSQFSSPSSTPSLLAQSQPSFGQQAASGAGKFLQGFSKGMQGNGGNSVSAFNQFSRYMNKGGMVDAMVSPGEKALDPKEAKQVAKGEKSEKSVGKTVPGKAKVKGDSEKNDTVPAKLEEGGVVIPRSVMNSEDPEKEAQKFVAKALQEHRKSPEGEFREALRRAASGRKNK